MSTQDLLDRLEKVKPLGADRWISRCPAHDDGSPSLSIREGDNGGTLIHCFAGCPAADVVAAIGLEMSDLFPPREGGGKPVKRAFNASQVLRCVTLEARVASMAANRMRAGETLSKEDADRLELAADRLAEALRICDK